MMFGSIVDDRRQVVGSRGPEHPIGFVDPLGTVDHGTNLDRAPGRHTGDRSVGHDLDPRGCGPISQCIDHLPVAVTRIEEHRRTVAAGA